MHSQDKKYEKNKLLVLPALVIIPIVLIFDLILYFANRGSCLSCSNLLEFLKTGSLTVFILSGISYQLGRRK